MRQILLSFVFVLSGVAQINAHHLDQENFHRIEFSREYSISDYFKNNPKEWRKDCNVLGIKNLAKDILIGVPPEVSLELFSKTYEGTGYSAKEAHGLIYRDILWRIHRSKSRFSEFIQSQYKQLSKPIYGSGNRYFLTRTEQDIIVSTNIACTLFYPEDK